MVSALIVVDVQNDFCPGGALAVRRGDEILPLVNGLLDRFPLSVLTQDWHPRGHCSFASSRGLAPYSPDPEAPGGGPLWPDHCVAGTAGAEFRAGLRAERARLVLRKGTDRGLDSYSAFLENDRRTTTGLAAWLKALGVGRIVVAGIAAEYCVEATALDGLAAGFLVDVAQDAVAAVDAAEGDGGRALAELAAAGCRILDSGEVRP